MANTSSLGSDDEAPPKQELYLSLEVIKTLPVFLQPGDEQERNDLAMFLSQVDHLHKPATAKLSARSVFNYLQNMLKSSNAPPNTEEGPSQVTFPEHMKELTENIAFEIASNVASDVDIHNTTISVLGVLEEVSWETKTALTIFTFVLTFGDKGLNLCEKSKVSANEIQMFAELKGGYKHQLEGSTNLFTIVFYLIGYIVEFENLPVTYRTSMDHKVKVERTQLIVIVYWIIRVIVAASSSHIIRLSSMGNEFDKTILALKELSYRWSKNMKDLSDKEHLKAMLSKLQELLKKDVDIDVYNKIKAIIEQRNHSDNMKVLNTLFPSNVHPLYDCLLGKKVHLNDLKGAYALLFISGLEEITPDVSENKLNEFIDSFDVEGKNKVECNIVWMPIVDEDHSLQRNEATEKSMVKPFMDLFYVVHQKLNPAIEYRFKKQTENFKGWYYVDNPSMISNEVKKFIMDDWKYKNGEPMIVVLDPQGKVVNHNAIHMFYIWGVKAFPFTSEREEDMWKNFNYHDIYLPLGYSFRHFYFSERRIGYLFYYGGENVEWIRSLTGMMREIERERKIRIKMVYVGRSHNQDQMRSVNEEKLSLCLTDPYYMWLFWKRLDSIIYSGTHTGRFYDSSDKRRLQMVRRWLSYDKSNVGWVFSYDYHDDTLYHGKVALSTLKEFRLWKETASNEGFLTAFKSHYNKIYRKMFPFECLEYPTRALKAPIQTMLCPECNNQMQEYTAFLCYHPHSTT